MKQYKTALNHLIQIDEVKEELIGTIKKTINQEINQVCSEKTSMLRSTNIDQFKWKTAQKELLSICPTTLHLLKVIAGKGDKHMPRIVSCLGILLFTRNQQVNTLQTINSILMFRGHVRTRVGT